MRNVQMCIREVKRHYILQSKKFEIQRGHESQKNLNKNSPKPKARF